MRPFWFDKYVAKTNERRNSNVDVTGHGMPILHYIFVAVDEMGKEGFLVRRYYAGPHDPYLLRLKLPPSWAVMELDPMEYGLNARDVSAPFSPAEHALGNNKSKYVSSSTNFSDGAIPFKGKTVFVDIAKLKASGGVVISPEELIADLLDYKHKYPHQTFRVDTLINAIRTVESEALILPKDGHAPSKALVTPGQFRVKRLGRGLMVISIAFTAYDLGKAGHKSIEQGSLKPVGAETIRQAGGWGAGVAGMAVGAKLGAWAGGAISIPTGPGAAVGAAVGGLIVGAFFGIAGYFGADWVADEIDEN
jgi:hypothetical protein